MGGRVQVLLVEVKLPHETSLSTFPNVRDSDRKKLICQDSLPSKNLKGNLFGLMMKRSQELGIITLLGEEGDG